MMVDVVPESADVIGELFRERERLADKPAAALAQRIVEAFDMVGLAAAFAAGAMAFRG
jgi:hypothetical protein